MARKVDNPKIKSTGASPKKVESVKDSIDRAIDKTRSHLQDLAESLETRRIGREGTKAGMETGTPKGIKELVAPDRPSSPFVAPRELANQPLVRAEPRKPAEDAIMQENRVVSKAREELTTKGTLSKDSINALNRTVGIGRTEPQPRVKVDGSKKEVPTIDANPSGGTKPKPPKIDEAKVRGARKELKRRRYARKNYS